MAGTGQKKRGVGGYRAGLPAGGACAAFGAVVRPIGVHLDLHVGLDEGALLRQGELQVFDGESPVEPLVFVVGMDAEDEAYGMVRLAGEGMVEVVGGEEEWQAVYGDNVAGVGKEEVGVGLEMHRAAVGKEMPVALQEECGGEAFGGLLHLGVGEGEPNLRHLSGGEELVDELDVGAQERHIAQPFAEGFGGSVPHTRPLDVDADEVEVWEHAGEPHAVFAPSAPELEHDGVGVAEEMAVPLSAKGVAGTFGGLEGCLHHVGIGGHVGEFREFIFPHNRRCR